MSSIMILVAVASIVTLFLRALPFLVFHGKRQMPDMMKHIVSFLPPGIMGVLVIYCLKSVQNVTAVASLIAIMVVVIVHVWKRKTLLSIAVGTALYMCLIRLL